MHRKNTWVRDILHCPHHQHRSDTFNSVAWRQDLFALQTPVTLWLHSVNQNRNFPKTIKNIQHKVTKLSNLQPRTLRHNPLPFLPVFIVNSPPHSSSPFPSVFVTPIPPPPPLAKPNQRPHLNHLTTK
jgi:hypothetical protein